MVRRTVYRNNRSAKPLMRTRGADPFLLFPDLAAAEAEQRQAGGPARIPSQSLNPGLLGNAVLENRLAKARHLRARNIDRE